VERLYLALRERCMRYDFKPGARINEQALGRELGVSRAPLREALNRLAAEGLLDFVMNKGFLRKAISVDEVFDLYQGASRWSAGRCCSRCSGPATRRSRCWASIGNW